MNNGNRLLEAVTGIDPDFLAMLNSAQTQIGIVRERLKYEMKKATETDVSSQKKRG